MTTAVQNLQSANTQSVTLEAPYDQVFSFLSDPATLPIWAVGFARSIRRDGQKWFVTTANGETEIRYEVDKKWGVIDYHFTAAPGVEAIAYSRIVPNGDGAEYLFTFFQIPTTRDEVFQGQVDSLSEELEVLRRTIRARQRCRAD